MELAHTTHGVVGGLKQAKSAFWGRKSNVSMRTNERALPQDEISTLRSFRWGSCDLSARKKGKKHTLQKSLFTRVGEGKQNATGTALAHATAQGTESESAAPRGAWRESKTLRSIENNLRADAAGEVREGLAWEGALPP